MVLDNIGVPIDLYWKSHSFTKTGAKFVQVGSEVSLGFVDEIFGFEEVPKVYTKLKTGHARGKVVVRIANVDWHIVLLSTCLYIRIKVPQMHIPVLIERMRHCGI